jgi:hypothetical protein
VRATSQIPWRAYAREPVVLALVGLTALVVVHATSVQDLTRIGLTQSLVDRGSLTIDQVAGQTIDRARHGGHYYSDKAPGMSIAAVPSYAALEGLHAAAGTEKATLVFHYRDQGTFQVWFVRVLTGGVFFLVTVFLVGRVAEGLAPGTGAVSAVAFGLGTTAGPLAATTFDHGAAGALGFAGFLAAWRALGRPPGTAWLAAAGLCAGFAVFFEYQAAVVAVLLAAYVMRAGLRPLGTFVAGSVPALLALAVYNTAAFGSPNRFSYRYVQNIYTAEQHRGVFGVTEPSLHRLRLVLVGDRGLLLSSPVLVLGAVGLGLLWRRGLRAEAGLAGVVAAAFLVVEAGYFLPYGGISPGPRFFVPALPFLALGFPLAFRRWPLVTYAGAVFSVLATTEILLMWALTLHGRVLATTLDFPRLAGTAWERLGASSLTGARIVMATAFVTVLVAGYELLRSRRPDRA